MIRKESLLDNVKIATPCPARWAEMHGNDKMRFCGLCKLNVYDVSAMTSEEAEALMRETSGRLCMRLHRRSDGRILTKDCPVGKAALRKRIACAIAGGVALLLTGLSRASAIANTPADDRDRSFAAFYETSKRRLLETGYFGPPPEPEISGNVTLGMVAVP